MGVSKVDLWYRKLVLTKFYTRGWGKPEEMKDILKMHKLISKRETCSKLISSDYPVNIDKITKLKTCNLVHGHFTTPLMDILPNLVPASAQIAKFEIVLPKNDGQVFDDSNNVDRLNPACIHMAGTGDHGYHRRRELLAKPLLLSGITSVLLENPFYGSRKPKDQWRSGLLHVNDLFIMGGCLILEAQVLLHWLKRMGYGPLGLTGISMGGHMASLAATNWPEPLALIPCMSWTSASVVWTEGVLSKAIPWRVLESQYSKDPKYEVEVAKVLGRVDSYQFGKSFVADDTSLSLSDSEANLQSDKRNMKKMSEMHRQQETIKFMKGVMDEITHLGNYSIPIDPTVVTFVVAKEDAYFPQSSLAHMKDVWPGCEVREINAGHVAGYLMYHNVFTKAIVDTFSRLAKKSKDNPPRLKEHIRSRRKSASDKVSELVLSRAQSNLFKPCSPVPIFTTIKCFVTKA